ncbi:MAG: hypothetical protein WDN00_16000 [Limisphaerales bacterium]
MLTTNTDDVVIFNLEDKIREDLLNTTVNEHIKRHETKLFNRRHRRPADCDFCPAAVRLSSAQVRSRRRYHVR